MKVNPYGLACHCLSRWGLLAICLAACTCVWAKPSKPIGRTVATAARPLLFEENEGQFDPSVKFLAKGRGYNIALGRHPVIELFRYQSQAQPNQVGFAPALGSPSPVLKDHALFRMRLIGANPEAPAIPIGDSVSKTHYLSGAKANWKTDISTFKAVRYEGILDKIDVLYYGNNRLCGQALFRNGRISSGIEPAHADSRCSGRILGIGY